MSIVHLLVLLFFSVFLLVPCWRIVARAGFPGALALLLWVPLLNLVALWVFAFVPWPARPR
jgi:hypothetical protein